MPVRPPDPELERSTDRWMIAGIVLTILFVLAFPAYRLYEPGSRAAARSAQVASLVMQGESLFSANCASCHGVQGVGVDAPALNSQQFLGAASDEQVAALISHGVPGSAMAAYSLDFGGYLTSEQIEAVTVFLRSLEASAPDRLDWRSVGADGGHDDEEPADAHEEDEPGDAHEEEGLDEGHQEEEAATRPTTTTTTTTSSTTTTVASFDGATAFAAKCAACHGADLGGGEGPPLGPTSHSLGEPDEHLFEAIWLGRDRMPSFMNDLTEDQVSAVIAYIRGVQVGS